MGDEQDWCKAERLAVAAAVAPVLRSQSERSARRVVKVYDQKTGDVVRHATLADVQRSLLETAKIELSVTEGARPTHVACEFCGRIIPVGKGSVPKSCRGGCDRQQTCAGWGPSEGRCMEVPGPLAFKPAHVRMRNGGPWRCKACGHAMRRKPAYCVECGAEMRTKDGKRGRGLRCAVCTRVARRKTIPACASCGKTLSQSARVQPIKHCRNCFRKTPEFLAKVRASAAKARDIRWSKHRERRSAS